MLNKGMIHVPDKMEQECVRFWHPTQNSEQFNTYKLFLSGIFNLYDQTAVDHEELKLWKVKSQISEGLLYYSNKNQCGIGFTAYFLMLQMF